ncbi:MAG: YiiX/YebB-like N1pC/P60 family cysteine hydrolase [Verrucomicrobium sp.]
MVFQPLPHGALVDAIESVSQAPVSHCGIVVQRGGQWMVLEAYGTVGYTPLPDWLRRGRKGNFFACRFKSEVQVDLPKFIAAAESYIGRAYDIRYAFGNVEIYCSELPYLAYKRVASKPLGQVKKLGEVNWKPNEAFIRAMEGGALPLERRMITPVDLSQAPELERVHGTEGY